MLGLWAVKRLRQQREGQPANVLPLYLIRPTSADRPLAAEGRTARASGGGEPGGGAQDERRSPTDERPAQTVARGAIATRLRHK